MNTELELYIPRLEDLWFYQKMMSDPETMSYNAGWDVDYAGYHQDTGCIDYPDEQLPGWHAYWVGQEPTRFYAYIRRKTDGAWIGDVNFHYIPEDDWHDVGIVIYAPYRGMGFSVPALRLLLDRAFRICSIRTLHNEFETTRDVAWIIHRKVGFQEIGMVDGLLQMVITKDDYLSEIEPITLDDKIRDAELRKKPTSSSTSDDEQRQLVKDFPIPLPKCEREK